MSSDQDALSANKRALLKIRELKQQLADREDASPEPIAVVSMACRFPSSADTPQKFWEQLLAGESHVGDVPESRWDPEAFFDEDPETPGKMYTQKGVYLDQIDQMDPEFFGISPREATWVDPQQRLLMEVSWEAIERAGWIPEKVGSSTGVFVGWMHNDYQNEASDSFLNLNPYIATGAAGSFLCGRLAYYLGLHGPALAVDTACSSSLVALHLAIQSLNQKECDRALVGGVNVICSPTTNILTCKLKALSPNGHSRAFDAAADGYLRGEGCGVVALRRLSDARKDGDRVLGIIRGSAVGHNGFSSGLTAPNPKAQEMVIRQALERAGIEPNEVDYLEAHGTGTELGDPLEVQAASAALCQQRAGDQPLLIGSVKTNIGHLEAAAGMAGLIKVLLAMQNDQLPGQLNFDEPNPHIPWDKTAIKVLAESQDWPNSARRIAGVSAFGMSGTNAHVVLEAPVHETHDRSASVNVTTGSDKKASPPDLLTISAKNKDALLSLVDDYLQLMEDLPEETAKEEFSAVCRAAQLSRSHFEHRAAVVADSKESALASLRKLARNQADDRTSMGQANKRFKLAWQFTGQGSQYVGMGAELFDTEHVFRDAVLECENWMQEYRDQKLTDVLFRDPEAINDTLWTQPGIFAIQMGLSQLLTHWGMRPDVVLGHSVGQYAAACVAGIISWQDGLRLISERGRVISSLPRSGQMLAVFANAELVEELVVDRPGVDLGAYNVSHVVVSGESSEIEKLQQEINDRGIKTKILQTSHAFHSHLMNPILDEFADFANQFEYRPSRIPLICNQSGDSLPADFQFTGKYWADHIRGAVQYQQSLRQVMESNCDALLELGPKAVLTGMARSMSSAAGPLLLSCLDQATGNSETLLRTVAALYTRGLNPAFENLSVPEEFGNIELPTYPFQRRRFWGPDKPRAAHAEHHTSHPLLGSPISLANSNQETRYESFVDSDSPAWMSDHQVLGTTVMPGAGFVEIAIAAAKQTGKSLELQDLRFETPLRIGSRTALQTVFNHSLFKEQKNESNVESENGEKPPVQNLIESYSRAEPSNSWTRHFVVGGCAELDSGSRSSLDLAQLQKDHSDQIDVDDFYSFLESIDLGYGERFRTIESLAQSENGVLSKLVERADLQGYTVSPPLLDGAFHSLAVAISRDGDEMFLPVGLGKVRVFGEIAGEIWCHAKWVKNEGNVRVADLTLFTEQGQVLVEIEQLQVQRMARSSMRQASRSGPQHMLYEWQWRKSRLAGPRLEKRYWWIVGCTATSGEFAAQLADEMLTQGHRSQTILMSDRQSDPTEDPDWSDIQSQFSQSDDELEFPHGIIWITADNSSLGPRDINTESNARGLLSLVQWLRKSGVRGLDSGLQIVSSNAVDLSVTDEEDSDRPVDPQQSQYWGLGRVLSAECPEYRCRLIDLDRDLSKNECSLLADVLLTDNEENQIAIQGKDFFVPRISTSSIENLELASENKEITVRPDASFLITGGLGKLGRQAAKWLAEKNASQIVLVSRRQPDDETAQFLKQIESHGAEIVIQNIDVTDVEEVNRLFELFGQSLRPLAGVIHAAGVLDDGLIDNQNWSRFDKVLRPKIDAAWNLHQASLNHSLDFFVLYSSIASVLGSPGQSNYAMGNAYLDGLASLRHSLGLPAISVNWGPWTEGMADDEKVKRRLAAQGITALEVKDAHAALEIALKSKQQQAFVIDVDWRKLKLGADGKTPLILSELVKVKTKGQASESQLVAKLKKLKPAARQELLVSTVQKIFQEVLASETPPDIDRPLIEMGLDSLMAVEFGTGLQQAFGGQYEIGPSLLFDHPTIESIAEYLGTLIFEESENTTDQATLQATEKDVTQSLESIQGLVRDDIAIIGMSCRFPGANNVNEYWQNLLDGVDSVGEIPDDRWDVDRFFSAEREAGKMYTREGGFLDDIGQFDAAFFNISDTEACWIDPQHRMLLENSYHALEHAGINHARLSQTNVGVFMGIMGQDYAFLPTLDDREVVAGFEGAGLSHSAGVGRISHLLGLEGPSVAIDTASSSSLVAVIQAMRSLQEGNCNMALAGGANAILAPVNSLLMSKAGLLSPDGRCKSFSEQADGFGRGEGCGVVVLKRLSDAQRDQDQILAVIRGGAIGHNGFTGGLTTPSSKAQTRVIESAVRDAGISPSQVQYLEAHGTGTEFGDPIEMAAAVQVYGKGRKKNKPLVVGSAKANIGHLEAAGGVSGLIKAVLSLHHGVVPKQIHFESPSKHIPWKRMPVQIPSDSMNWDDEKLEFAAVTALGLAGTNAHLVLSACPEREGEKSETVETTPALATNSRKQALFISAKSKHSLTELLESYRSQFRSWQATEKSPSWESVCFNSGQGRQHFDLRECIVAESLEEAERLLDLQIESRREEVDFGENGSMTGKRKSHMPGKIGWYFSGQDHFSISVLDRLCEQSAAVSEMVRGFNNRMSKMSANGRDLRSYIESIESNSDDLVRFVVYAALAKMWKSWGLDPDVVSGCGVGQLVAGCVADVLQEDDAFELAFFLHQNRSQTNWDEFEKLGDQFNYHPPDLNLICPLTGQPIPVHQTPGGSYWRQFFEQEPGADKILEDPQVFQCNWLMIMGSADMLSSDSDRWNEVTSKQLHHGFQSDDVGANLLDNLAELYQSGFTPDFGGLFDLQSMPKLSLPFYPFDKKRYWITEIGDFMTTNKREEEPTGATHV